MKITAIKSSRTPVGALAHRLETLCSSLGFDVVVKQVNASRIDITGEHRMKGPQRFNYTYRVSIAMTKKGYSRCYTPTWKQYEALNHAINALLDCYGVKATIKSLDYKIRDKVHGRIVDWDKPEYIRSNESKGYGPIFTTEAEVKNYVAGFKGE